MSKHKPEVLARAYQDAERWLIDTAGRIQGCDDLQDAYHALRSVLHLVRDNLIPEEAIHLSSQLPTMVRGIYFEGYRLQDAPAKHRSRNVFLEALGEHLQAEGPVDLDPQECARAVFATLDRHLDAGQVEHVRGMLHKEVQELWPGS